jgi:hypothetical protein
VVIAGESSTRIWTTVHELIAVLTDLAEAEPTAELERNHVGNLLIVVDGEDIGYVNPVAPRWERWADDDDDTEEL